MKIKVRAEDFVVREVSTLKPTPQLQSYAIFRLTKTNWDTFAVVLNRAAQQPDRNKE